MAPKEPTAENYNPFSFYHQNEALLFQFFLHECLRTHQTLKQKPSLSILLVIIGKENVSTVWQAPAGHLPRLCHYYSLLTTHFEEQKTLKVKSLKNSLNRAQSSANQCYALLDEGSEEHTKHYSQLKREIKKITKLLFEKLSEFQHNISILYFLLHHHEQFDAVYNEPIVKKLFSTFFPKGIQQAQSFLAEKLSKKGFNHLIPLVQEKLKMIENNDKKKSRR